MSTIRTRCPNDGDVYIHDERKVLIDIDGGAYQFFCPGSCHGVVRKDMDQRIFSLLRAAGVATIDEVVLSETIVLRNDEDIWRGILST